MSLHRITAGSGYDYLTRQVAAMDSTERGYTGLASYYTEKGEVPGRWVGSGLAGIDGIRAGDEVTADQMRLLFGSGHHPLADERAAAVRATPGATSADMRGAVRLGQPFRVYADDVSPFRTEIARRLEQNNLAHGRPSKAAATISERARIRTEVGLEFFRSEFGRDPLNTRELAGHIAKLSRQQTTAVAGFDLTFSPVKSVSALWALADPPLAGAIERAHQAAVSDALRFLEQHALFTRTGKNGLRQVEVRGLIGTAFTHRDSRAGDPDLHTHVAVANKVQTVDDGRWLAIDGRVLFKAITTASETYNTSLETHLAELGVRFEPRTDGDPRKRPVREVVGIDLGLTRRWSQRRQRIAHRQGELAKAFLLDHSRPPTPVEAIALAQQATLETRQAKHEPRTIDQQRGEWRDQARAQLGGDAAIQAMINEATHSRPRALPDFDADWFATAASRILERVEQDRSVWQTWHLRAEALRYARAHHVPGTAMARVVDHLVELTITQLSIPITAPKNDITEPAALRRRDGNSVYTVAGSALFTSQRILEAEQRIVTAAGHTGGRTVSTIAIELALLEAHANGLTLNPGQAQLVTAMATSGARVQLAIAPAGSGKTTAMQALSRAWVNDGGSVLGLAPSAVAAAGLGDQISGHTDTLAKLAWHLTHGDHPQWLTDMGPATLVIIDEAGMADTPSLDTVISHVLNRGASVRLIGDDQQLAAVGAGGVLRDIQASHGAVNLTELVRFASAAEAAASLALRQGQPEALGFYLDHNRVHVGDADTMTEAVFTAWASDREHGKDSIMLAPTRELAADLNQQARSHRLNGTTPNVEIELADGNRASVGDTIITRRNDRRLQPTATDWVKNGDRWTITDITSSGALAQHTQHRHCIVLPTAYLAEWAELGYACTTHSAQGVTADTCHGLLTGDESRQQAYTMLTRGRQANSCYLTIVGDGEPHTAIRPETVNPPTGTDLLQAILTRDDSATSATTAQREAHDPARLLGEAASSYQDGISFAADHTATPADQHTLTYAVDRLIPGLTDAPAWPALRAELHLLTANHHDPIAALTRAAAEPLSAGHDPAALLAWRVRDAQTGGGPLPWLDKIPARLANDPEWAGYLQARAQLVQQLADQVRDEAHQQQNPWRASVPGPITDALVADITVWRAANQIPDTDLQPTGPRLSGGPAAHWQQRLDQRLGSAHAAAINEWGPLLRSIDPHIDRDPFLATLAQRAAQLSSADLPARDLILQAANDGPLPDEHPAAALWWRITERLTPDVIDHTARQPLAIEWQPQLAERIGTQAARELQTSPWWPALATTIDQALHRGWNLNRLLDNSPASSLGAADTCQAWTMHLALLTRPIPDNDLEPDDHARGEDDPDWRPTGNEIDMLTAPPPPLRATADEYDEAISEDAVDDEIENALAIEALARRHMQPPELTASEIRHLQDRADAWRNCPCTPERIAHINELTATFYEHQFPTSWAQPYLEQRFRADLTGHPTIRPGYAPDSWTALTTHLRRHGISDEEMRAAGVTSITRDERTIDRFRDRVVFPITHEGGIIGFVARRNPGFDNSDNHGPKYLNTPTTAAFVKGDQLYAPVPLTPGAVPVVVEGPMDAIAVTIASEGNHIGVAPLGTSLTSQQAAQLRRADQAAVLATDADQAGQAAAARDYWTLAAQGIQPRLAELPPGTDPAALVEIGQIDRLLTTISDAPAQAAYLVAGCLNNGGEEAWLTAVQILAAQPPERWDSGATQIADQSGLPESIIKAALVPAVRAWTTRATRPANLQPARSRAVHPTTTASIAKQEPERRFSHAYANPTTQP